MAATVLYLMALTVTKKRCIRAPRGCSAGQKSNPQRRTTEAPGIAAALSAPRKTDASKGRDLPKAATHESWASLRRAWGIGFGGNKGDANHPEAMGERLRGLFDECSRRLGRSPPVAPASAAAEPTRATPAAVGQARSLKELLSLLAVAPFQAPADFVAPLCSALERLALGLVPAEAVALLEQASGRGPSVTSAV
ncbi:hypothetical protein EMIHUDRAFT_218503 [Emiliania huxleyi CCMP1516]|uniref:Uncharacterized protein n=2 Tax=Emiliania huxleyi TaxID=2903 RepID=A0A0D3I8E5_EMIH1|nr:hypothetical protein EMIHUDRAFT_218503 [Emiliania huxleyi CCMP1516]EOD07530.1 hypothetical protein EMIHUDRAFT_218503 [Emiliania huxleyi CCMP1516]|eukprot:XP_005759959.1 hypothetical protein EMIHUDRAFT_218503 [Emiliania huxleyi CCMP1516]